MKDVVARLQRELPDTDKDRYDVAYERGRAQARSGLLFGGLAIGSAIGAGLMWLLDPVKGAGRRAQLSQRATGLRNDLSKTVAGKTEDLQNRAQGFAIERGIKEPPTNGSSGEHPHDDAGWNEMTHTSSGSSSAGAAGMTTASTSPEAYGEGYREGFGATAHDPTAPGARVPDPLTADEIVEHGPSGPVAGAGHDMPTSVVTRETEEQESASSR